MKQVLHVFLKDLRHYWREGAVSVALMAAFVRNQLHGWAHSGARAYGLGGLFTVEFLVGLADVLLPVAWAFLIVRVIHEESLVGDREFWLTRPYEWKKLLAAKALFVVIFVNLPMLIAGVFLLLKAGFAVTPYAAGLLAMQLLMIVFFLVPVASLATLTRTLPQLLVGLLCVALYMVGMAWVANQIPSSNFSSPTDSVSGILVIATCVAIIVLQYARRATTASRWLIGSLGFAVLLITLLTPYGKIVAAEFPSLASDQHIPFRLDLLPSQSHSDPFPESENSVDIQLPMAVSAVQADAILNIDGLMLEIDSPNDLHWNSGWTSPGLRIFPDTKRLQTNFAIKRKVFERMKLAPVNARVSLAFTLYRDADRRNFVIPDGKFGLEGVGYCVAGLGYDRSIHCLSPLRGPSSLLISSDMSEGTCPTADEQSLPKPGTIARDWIETEDSRWAVFGINPVKEVQLFLSNFTDPVAARNAGLCPGTPVILSTPELVRRNQTAIQLDHLQLSDYQRDRLRLAIGTASH